MSSKLALINCITVLLNCITVLGLDLLLTVWYTMRMQMLTGGIKVNKDDELLKDILVIVKEGEDNMRRYGHFESPLARELCMIQQAHYHRVNEDAHRTQQEIRRRIAESK